jgi:hypothetical protein
MASVPSVTSGKKELEWCGISLEDAFVVPTNLAALAPEEQAGRFMGEKHERQYGELVEALMREKELLQLRQKEEVRAEKGRLQKRREWESKHFHREFLMLLRWGEDGEPSQSWGWRPEDMG